MHSRYGAHLGIQEGEIFADYANELLKLYETALKDGDLDKDLHSEKIPIHWVHSVLSRGSSGRIAEQTVGLLRHRIDELDHDTVVAAFILLDSLERSSDVVALWKEQTSQLQFDLFEGLIARDHKYRHFANELAALVQDGVVSRQLSPDASYSLPFRKVVDDYILEVIQSDKSKLNELLPLIVDTEIRLVAQASCKALDTSKQRQVEDAFWNGKRDGILGCKYRFEFANSEAMAEALIRDDFLSCHADRFRGLQTLAVQYPDLVASEIGALATSARLEDTVVVIKYFGGPRFSSLETLPLVVKSVSSFVRSTPNSFLTGVRQWPITCSVFSHGRDGIVVSPYVLAELDFEKQRHLYGIAAEINDRCGTTFFSKTLREAILAARDQPKRSSLQSDLPR